jgi:hypothetical protein
MTLSRTLWTMRSAGGKEITAAIYDVATGRELRVSATDSLRESRLSRTGDAPLEARAGELRSLWKAKGGSPSSLHR